MAEFISRFEEFRKSDCGKAAFYVLLGVAFGFIIAGLLRPAKIMSLKGCGNYNSASASGEPLGAALKLLAGK